MLRRILQERRIRAIAAIHAMIGAAVIVGAIAWLAASSHAHGLAAAAIPFIAGVEVIVGALFTLIAYLLWIYHPTGKWITAVLSAGATACSICLLVLLTARVIEDW